MEYLKEGGCVERVIFSTPCSRKWP